MLTDWGVRGASAIGHVDEVRIVGGDSVDDDTIPRGAYVSFRGWLVNRADEGQPDELLIRIGEDSNVTLALGFPRPDVGANLGVAIDDAGFYGVGPISAPIGRHPVSIGARFGSEVRRLECDAHCTVVPFVDPLAGASRRHDGWAAAVDGFYRGAERLDADAANGTTVLPGASPASLRLWCVDLRTGTPPLAVIARMGGCFLNVIDGVERPDVVADLGTPGALYCGYSVPSLPPLVGIGRLEIFALFEDGTYGLLPPVQLRLPEPLSSVALPVAARVMGQADEVRVDGRTFASAEPLVMCSGETLWVRGWAIDTVGPRLTAGVEAYVGGVSIVSARRGAPRPDIVVHVGHSAVLDSEFIVELRGDRLGLGSHQLELWGLSAQANARGRFLERHLEVTAAG